MSIEIDKKLYRVYIMFRLLNYDVTEIVEIIKLNFPDLYEINNKSNLHYKIKVIRGRFSNEGLLDIEKEARDDAIKFLIKKLEEIEPSTSSLNDVEKIEELKKRYIAFSRYNINTNNSLLNIEGKIREYWYYLKKLFINFYKDMVKQKLYPVDEGYIFEIMKRITSHNETKKQQDNNATISGTKQEPTGTGKVTASIKEPIVFKGAKTDISGQNPNKGGNNSIAGMPTFRDSIRVETTDERIDEGKVREDLKQIIDIANSTGIISKSTREKLESTLKNCVNLDLSIDYRDIIFFVEFLRTHKNLIDRKIILYLIFQSFRLLDELEDTDFFNTLESNLDISSIDPKLLNTIKEKWDQKKNIYTRNFLKRMKGKDIAKMLELDELLIGDNPR